MDQTQAPLLQALVERSKRKESSFHVPGHKFGASLQGEEKDFFGSVMELDYTEIEGLDDLHHPEGPILAAQQLAAECFGAEETFFLVGGSTAGNLALIGAVCQQDDLILVQRNAHKSVIHALMLARARAVMLEPEVDRQTGIAGGVARTTLHTALERYPQAKAVFLTNPNYYGMGWDLEPYARLVHGAGMALLVDEAHGAHFGLHPGVPVSALSRGADGVVQSTHKMLTAMTMGAMLHVQGNRIPRDVLRERLTMLQSSSPSYPIMASLDMARRYAAIRGEAEIGAGLEELRRFREALAGMNGTGIRVLMPEPEANAYDVWDPYKLVMEDAAGGRTGFQLLQELAGGGIIGEMADDRYAVLAASPATGREDLERLAEVIASLPGSSGYSGGEAADVVSANLAVTAAAADPVSEPVPMGLTGVNRGTPMPLGKAVGMRAAQAVVPYPPGIPLLIPGETISAGAAERILRLYRAGAKFQGAPPGPGCSILVTGQDS
ncbi:aminotransferase class I/II-fold pyridoxal phosphate-dependent enzyme [Paenibacillus mesotrionivorans]|uniref:Aminotransferase class I/II-fold pyridoxal phosphate-dependent enzyme n=1 Tax=Paenibacillus mesotrionivorans TaxID=3160968 RepID=A0ACC7P927_9BACL